MVKGKKFSAALVLAVMMAVGASSFSAPAFGATGTLSTSYICTLLAQAKTAASSLKDSAFKTYLINFINKELAAYGCA